MKTFADTNKGKKLAKKGNKGGQQATSANDSGKQPAQSHIVSEGEPEPSGSPAGSGDDMDSVMKAREQMKNRFSKS